MAVPRIILHLTSFYIGFGSCTTKRDTEWTAKWTPERGAIMSSHNLYNYHAVVHFIADIYVVHVYTVQHIYLIIQLLQSRRKEYIGVAAIMWPMRGNKQSYHCVFWTSCMGDRESWA